MHRVTVIAVALLFGTPAVAGVRWCSDFPHPVRFAVAYQTPQGWVSEGWVKVAPKSCVEDTKHADLTNFMWTAESDPYDLDGQKMKSTWGKNQSFAVKDGDFTLKNADKKSKGARLANFAGPVSFTLPAIVATVQLEADGRGTRTTIPGPNSVSGSDPDVTACDKSSGDEAIAGCDRAIQSNKYKGTVLAGLYNNRGVERKGKKDIDGAMSDYNEALKLNPKNALAYVNRGNLFFDKGDYDAAIADFTRGIESDPKFEKSYSRRGDAYNQQKNYDKAIDDYKNALTRNPNAEKKATIERVLAGAYVNRGLTQKNPEAELADYNEALKFNPSSTAALNNRATMYAAKGDYDRAIADLDQAIKLKPDYAMAYRNRGDAYRDKGDKDKAIADYKQALANNPNDNLKKQVQAALDKLTSDGAAAAPAETEPAAKPSEPPSEPGDASDSDAGQVDFRDQ
jgi:tetratricopeptide (TPR) repeat protein/uncharacterized membrane protein